MREAHQTDRRGVTLRFEKEDLIDLDQLSSAIKELTELLKVDPVEADVLFDLKFVGEADEAYQAHRVASALEILPYASEWRSVFIAASAFPENLSEIPAPSEGAPNAIYSSRWINRDRG